MKTVIALTDFSENATSAAETAWLLAGKMHSNLLLYNSYITYPGMTAYAGGPWLVDEFIEKQNQSKERLELLTEGLELLSERLGPDDRMPSISFISEDNDLGSGMSVLTAEKNVELIVMGARSEKNEENVLFGNDTSTVIEHAGRPIMITPTGTNLENLHKLVFATDFEEADIKAMHYLAKLGNVLHCKLEIIHVQDSEKVNQTNDKREEKFKEKISQIRYTGITYHKVGGKNVINRLNRLLTETHAGLLAMVHVQNSFLIRLFQHSLVKEAIASQKMPLLIFPSNMA
jgi:nucleotide-binding universal stress UspA family protein